MNYDEKKNECMKNQKEYHMLREEIMHHKKRQNTMATFACTLVASLIGVAVTEDVPVLAAIATVIILPLSLKFFESRYSIALLSTYMRVFLSEEGNPNWENNLSEYYSLTQRQWHEKIVYFFSKFDFFFLSVACLVSFLFINYNSKAKLDKPIIFVTIIAIQLTIMGIIFYFTCKYYSYENLKNNKMNNWLELKINKEQLKKKSQKIYKNDENKEKASLYMIVSFGLFVVSSYEFVVSKILSFKTEKATIFFEISILVLSFMVYYISQHCNIKFKKRMNILLNKISNDFIFISGVSMVINTLTRINHNFIVKIISAISYLLLTVVVVAFHIVKYKKDVQTVDGFVTNKISNK